MRICTLLFVSTLLALPTQAQTKQVQSFNQTWYAYNNNTRLTNKWGIWFDIQNKTKENYFKNFDVKENTLGAIYYINDRTKLTSAFTYIQSYPNQSAPQFSVPEYRPWQMIQWRTNSGPFRFSHWIRLEERFKRKTINNLALTEGYDFSYRLRYNIFAQLPITKTKYDKGAISLLGSNEIYLNYGKSIVYNTFDQNRIFLGFFYYFNKHDYLQVGYTNAYQQLSAGNKYKSIDAIKLTFFNNLDFRKTQSSKKSK